MSWSTSWGGQRSELRTRQTTEDCFTRNMNFDKIAAEMINKRRHSRQTVEWGGRQGMDSTLLMLSRLCDYWRFSRFAPIKIPTCTKVYRTFSWSKSTSDSQRRCANSFRVGHGTPTRKLTKLCHFFTKIVCSWFDSQHLTPDPSTVAI